MSEQRTDHSYGIVPVLRSGDGVLLAMVHHLTGHWGFPKGHPEPGETPLETARRELREELGITPVSVEEGRPLEDIYSFERNGVVYKKTVTLWIGYVKDQTATPLEAELQGVRWITPKEAQQLVFPGQQPLIAEIERRVLG